MLNEVVIHSDIHVELTYVLMAHCVRFQFKNNESFHSEIIEHEVNIEIVNVGSYMLLTFDKSESSAKFKNKLFQIIFSR